MNETPKIPRCPECKRKMFISQYSYNWYCPYCIDKKGGGWEEKKKGVGDGNI